MRSVTERRRVHVGLIFDPRLLPLYNSLMRHIWLAMDLNASSTRLWSKTRW